MPRPPKNNSNRTRRDEILDEATRLFAERGYEGASMADLAERVGMRKASLFYHFASKEVLYAAVLERLLAAFGRMIARAAASDGPELSFPERLDALGDGIIDVFVEQPYAARLLLREVMDWGPVLRNQLAEKIVLVLNGAVQFISDGQQAGHFQSGDPRQIIVSIAGLHFMPFAIDGIIERLVGVGPMDESFVQARREALREHVRRLVLAKAPPSVQAAANA
jgi:TetR/AcrR family transcriptional regulator